MSTYALPQDLTYSWVLILATKRNAIYALLVLRSRWCTKQRWLSEQIFPRFTIAYLLIGGSFYHLHTNPQKAKHQVFEFHYSDKRYLLDLTRSKLPTSALPKRPLKFYSKLRVPKIYEGIYHTHGVNLRYKCSPCVVAHRRRKQPLFEACRGWSSTPAKMPMHSWKMEIGDVIYFRWDRERVIVNVFYHIIRICVLDHLLHEVWPNLLGVSLEWDL
jgi:hypothetical protein